MRKVLGTMALVFAVVATAVPAGAATIGPFAGSWDGTEAVQTGRIFRDGVASDGTGAKGFPGQFDASSQLYEVFTFFNDGPQDVVAIDSFVSNTNTHFSAWLGTLYDPVFLNNAPNYLGDAGNSVSLIFSILVPANSFFMVVASTNFGAASAMGSTFSFTVEGDNVVDPAAVPEPATLLLLTAGLGAIARKRLGKRG